MFKKLYDHAIVHHHNRKMFGSELESSEDSLRYQIRNDLEEEKYQFKPQINEKSRMMADYAKHRQQTDKEKPKYVFDSLYQDYYIKKHEQEQRV